MLGFFCSSYICNFLKQTAVAKKNMHFRLSWYIRHIKKANVYVRLGLRRGDVERLSYFEFSYSIVKTDLI